MIFLALIGALVIGVTLRLMGSGGSILTVPLLVLLLHRPEKLAIVESLAFNKVIVADSIILVLPSVTLPFILPLLCCENANNDSKENATVSKVFIFFIIVFLILLVLVIKNYNTKISTMYNIVACIMMNCIIL